MAGDDGQVASDMPKVSLRRLLSQLAAIALTVTPVAASARRADPDLQDLEDDREIDREHVEDQDAAAALGRGLAIALGELRPLSATQLAATWSLSRDPVRRLAVGIALEWTFPLVGDALVIDHLSRDPDPAVRAAAARAAWTRRPSGGDPGVLARLIEDPDPEVRAVAAAARP